MKKYIIGLLKNLFRKSVSIFAIIDSSSKVSKKAKIYRTANLSGSSVSDYSYVSPGSELTNAKVGKFCSIGRGCKLGLPKHKMYNISTSPVFNRKNNAAKAKWASKDFEEDTPVLTIGNDVWIGSSAVAMSGLKIADGAIIGALVAVLVVWIACTAKNSLLSVCLFGVITFVLYLVRFLLLDLIGIVSPMTALRLETSMRYGESSGRDWLIEDFFKQIVAHPVFGSHLDLFGYAHNIFVDSYVMYGVVFGNILPIICIFAFIYIVKILRNKEYFSVIAILFLQMFVFSMFSGCWGGSAPLQCLLILVLLYANETYNKNLSGTVMQK